MTKKYEPPIANVVMGIGLETGADYGWNRAKETPVAAVYGKYKQRASDESLSPDDRDKWREAALNLEFRNPDLFND